MNRERFETLADAHGGDITRWPARTREDAALLMAADPGFAREVLGRAAALDGLLATYQVQTPSGALVGRIVMGAQAARSRPRWTGWLAPAGLGAGLAAACAAGVLLGVQLTPAPEPTIDAESLINAVADGGFSLDEEA